MFVRKRFELEAGGNPAEEMIVFCRCEGTNTWSRGLKRRRTQAGEKFQPITPSGGLAGGQCEFAEDVGVDYDGI